MNEITNIRAIIISSVLLRAERSLKPVDATTIGLPSIPQPAVPTPVNARWIAAELRHNLDNLQASETVLPVVEPSPNDGDQTNDLIDESRGYLQQIRDATAQSAWPPQLQHVNLVAVGSAYASTVHGAHSKDTNVNTAALAVARTQKSSFAYAQIARRSTRLIALILAIGLIIALAA